MRILILTQTFPLHPRDSTAHFIYDFAKGFSDLGHQVVVLLPFHPKLQTRSFKGFKVLSFRYIWPDFFHLLGYGQTLENDQNLKWFVYFLAPFYYLFTIINLYRTISKYHVEVASAHWILPNGFIAAVVSRLIKVPLFITLPGSDVYIAKQNFIFKLMAKFAILSAKKIISNSPQLLKDLDVKGKVISYPVPPNHQLRIPRLRSGQATNYPLTIATAGRPVEKKGFEILKKIYPDIEIISGLPIDQFRQKLLSVDIFIAYSIRDSKGNLDDSSLTVLEAMACGCVVIASDLPGYRYILKHKFNGLLVSVNDPRSLTKAVNLLKKSPQFRHTIAINARKTIKQYFTPQKIAQDYLALFEATTK